MFLIASKIKELARSTTLLDYGCYTDAKEIFILEHGTIEIVGIIDSDLLRNSIAIDDALPEEFLDRGGGYIGYRLRFNPFGEVFHYDNGESVVSLCWCKLPTISRPYRYRGQDGAINYEG
jgi:hypothetical protein